MATQPPKIVERLLESGFLCSEDFRGGPPPVRRGRPGSGPDPDSLRFETLSLPGFEIHEALGEGAMGKVYRATDLRTKRQVALKFLLGVNPRAVKRFLREGQTLGGLTHCGIVRVFNLGVHHKRPYLVLELIEGGRTLGELLAAAPLATRVGAVREVAEAVAHAHAQGVVHRDLKPSNVLVTPLGQAKVCDFGLARKSEFETLTRSGAMVGTPNYMSPEQITGRGHTAGPAADVWALGVMLYQALCGELPFDAATLHQLLTKIVRGKPSRLSEVDPTIPSALAAVCKRALCLDPADRYPNAGAMAAALREAERDASTTRVLQGLTEQPLWRWAALAVLAAALGLAGLSAAVSSQSSRPRASSTTARLPLSASWGSLERALCRRDFQRVVERTDGLELGPSTRAPLLLRGWALRRMADRLDDSRELARRLVAAQPEDPEALALLAVCLASDDPQRSALLERSLELQPASGYAASIYAWQVGQRDRDRGRALWEAARTLPVRAIHRGSAWRVRGLQAAGLGEHARAVEAFKRALDDDESANVRLLLAGSLRSLGLLQAAERELQRALQAGERAHLQLGEVRELLGDRRGALAALEAGVEAHPTSSSLHCALGELLFRVQPTDLDPGAFEARFARAKDHFQRALDADPPASRRRRIEGRRNDAQNMSTVPRITDSLLGEE